MSSANSNLTMEFIQSFEWESTTIESGGERCHQYTKGLFRRAQTYDERHDFASRDAYLLLGHCAGLELDPRNTQHPFKPLIVSGAHRGWNLDAIDATATKLLIQLASTTNDPEMRARLADVAWVRARDFRSARRAIEAYIESSQRLNNDGQWIHARDRLERALRLSASLGGGGSNLRQQVLDYIEATLWSIDFDDRQRELQPARLMDLLLEFRAGDTSRLFALSKKYAKRGEAQQGLGWDIAQDYWRLSARWADLSGDHNAAHAARFHLAECFVSIAQDFLSAKCPDHLSASIQLQKAVEAFRQIGETKKAETVHRQLLEEQKLSMDQMEQNQQTLDIADIVNNSIDAVKNKEFTQALISLALMVPTLTIDQLRKSVEQSGDDQLFQDLVVSQERVNARGRVVGKHPSDEAGDAKTMLEASMFDRALLFRHLIVTAYIEPARHQITLEHHGSRAGLLPLLQYNSFVPPGREEIFSRGLLAGLEGDFLVANHLLGPQIENSLRELLGRQGVITSNLTSQGIQEDFNLTKVLAQPEMRAILGEDLWFDLRGLLTEPLGSNWRNVLAHGLVDQHEFYDSPSIYTWWIGLRMCVLSLLRPEQPV